ncbi:MAG: hypothetical protein ABEJ91_01125 [Candidatus Nanohaloarchaea archaeon]
MAEVRLSARESGGYTVKFPSRSLWVPPSRVSKNPSGDGWYHLGDGRYVRVSYVEFRVKASPDRDSNSLEVPVTVEASATSRDRTSVSSQLVYVREHTFGLEVNRRLQQDDAENSGGGIEWIEVEDGKGTPENDSSSPDSVKNYKQGGRSKDTGGSGVDSTTVVLLILVIAMAMYTYRVA